MANSDVAHNFDINRPEIEPIYPERDIFRLLAAAPVVSSVGAARPMAETGAHTGN